MIKGPYRLLAIFLIIAVGASSSFAGGLSEQGVSVGGVNAVLIRPAKPRASIILLAGGSGQLGITSDGVITQLSQNQLVRTRGAYAAHVLAVLVPDYGVDLAQAVAYMAAIKRPVTVAGMSRGTQRAAQGIANGARPDKLVLTSGFLSDQSGDADNVSTRSARPQCCRRRSSSITVRTDVGKRRRKASLRSSPGPTARRASSGSMAANPRAIHARRWRIMALTAWMERSSRWWRPSPRDSSAGAVVHCLLPVVGSTPTRILASDVERVSAATAYAPTRRLSHGRVPVGTSWGARLGW